MPNAHKITPQEALQRTIEHREIFHDEMLHLMRLSMNGEMSPVMMALPFKLMLFVLVDGWHLLLGSLVMSFST